MSVVAFSSSSSSSSLPGPQQREEAGGGRRKEGRRGNIFFLVPVMPPWRSQRAELEEGGGELDHFSLDPSLLLAALPPSERGERGGGKKPFGSVASQTFELAGRI